MKIQTSLFMSDKEPIYIDDQSPFPDDELPSHFMDKGKTITSYNSAMSPTVLSDLSDEVDHSTTQTISNLALFNMTAQQNPSTGFIPSNEEDLDEFLTLEDVFSEPFEVTTRRRSVRRKNRQAITQKPLTPKPLMIRNSESISPNSPDLMACPLSPTSISTNSQNTSISQGSNISKTVSFEPMLDPKATEEPLNDDDSDDETVFYDEDEKNKRAKYITELDKKSIGDATKWTGINTIPDDESGRLYGHVERVLTEYEKRIQCSKTKTHRPPQCGIFGNGNNGEAAESIVASSMGGYGDEDMGDIMIYTGQGGSETVDQTLNSVNKSLTISMTSKTPVRVVRGFQLQEKYAPASGYRYDGLYWVTNYWKERQTLPSGRKGAYVYKFRLVRLENQPAIPIIKDLETKKVKLKKLKRSEIIGNYNSGEKGRAPKKRKSSRPSSSEGYSTKTRRRRNQVNYEEVNDDIPLDAIEVDASQQNQCILTRSYHGRGNSYLKAPMFGNNEYYYFKEREMAINKYSTKYGFVTSQYDRAEPSKDHRRRFFSNQYVNNTESLEKPIVHWHGSSSEFTEMPLQTRNEPDGVFIENIEQQLQYVYKHGQSIGNQLDNVEHVEQIVKCMLAQIKDSKKEEKSNILQGNNNMNGDNNESVPNEEPSIVNEPQCTVPFIVHSNSEQDQGSLISTSFMLSEIDTKNFIQFLTFHAFGKRKLHKMEYEDVISGIEDFLRNERQLFNSELVQNEKDEKRDSSNILKLRKQKHFERIRGIMDDIEE